MDYREDIYFGGTYFIWNGRRVKIGHGNNIRDRMKTMQIENDEILKLIGYIQVDYEDFQHFLSRKYIKYSKDLPEHLKINEEYISLEHMYERYCRDKWSEEEKEHQEYFNEFKYEGQWFDITLEEAREYIRSRDGILPLKHTIQTFGWEDIGDFFIVKNKKDYIK